jgi:hypothetical protein
MTMAQGGAVGSRRIPARRGFSALAIAGGSSLTSVAMGKGYHEVPPDNQSIPKVAGAKPYPTFCLTDERHLDRVTGTLLLFGLILNIRRIT